MTDRSHVMNSIAPRAFTHIQAKLSVTRQYSSHALLKDLAEDVLHVTTAFPDYHTNLSGALLIHVCTTSDSTVRTRH